MVLGVGSRKVGENCWTHLQCRRGTKNTYCKGLICVCELGFHQIEDRCSRNIWDDMGMQTWQLLALAFVATMIFISIFFLSLYILIKKLFNRYKQNKINPFGSQVSIRSQSSIKSVRQNIAARRKSIELANNLLSEDSEEEDSIANWGTPPSTFSAEQKNNDSMKSDFFIPKHKLKRVNSVTLTPQEMWETRGFDIGYVKHHLNWGLKTPRALSLSNQLSSDDYDLIPASARNMRPQRVSSTPYLNRNSYRSSISPKTWLYSSDGDGKFSFSQIAKHGRSKEKQSAVLLKSPEEVMDSDSDDWP